MHVVSGEERKSINKQTLSVQENQKRNYQMYDSCVCVMKMNTEFVLK